MAKLVKKRYAKALFELAVERGKVDAYYNDASLVLNSFGADADFVKIINHPQVTYNEKASLIDKAFKDRINVDLIALFNLIFKKNREAELEGILTEFQAMVLCHKQISKAEIVAAIMPSDTQLAEIERKLTAKLNKKVDLSVTIDPSLIAGMLIKVDGKIIDGSVKRHIADLKKQLQGGYQ